MKQLSFQNSLQQDDYSAISSSSIHLSSNSLQSSNKSVEEASFKANVTEIIISEGMADNVQMILPMLNHLNQEKRWLAWIDPPVELLKGWRNKLYIGEQPSLNTDEIMVLRSDSKHSALKLTQQALTTGTCHAAIMWTKHLSNEDYNKLEQASAKGNSHGIVLRYR